MKRGAKMHTAQNTNCANTKCKDINREDRLKTNKKIKKWEVTDCEGQEILNAEHAAQSTNKTVVWWWWWWWWWWYSVVLRSRADSLHSHLILHEWLAFYSAFLNVHWSGADMAGATWSGYRLGAFCVRHTTMHRVTSCKATYDVGMRV